MTDSTVIVRVDDELKTAFADAARASDRTASQLLRDYMRAYVRKQKKTTEYEAWFRKKVDEGLRDLDAGRSYSSEEVEADIAKRRSAQGKRGAAKAGRRAPS